MKRKIFVGLFFLGFIVFLYVFIEKPYSKRHFVTLQGKTLEVEVAATPYARQKGLMGRQNLPKNQGMLFIFPHEGHLTFWMKNTLIPLSIAFISDQKKITQIETMLPDAYQGKLPEYTSKTKVRYALEVNQNWFKENHIEVGGRVSFSHSIRRLKAE